MLTSLIRSLFILGQKLFWIGLWFFGLGLCLWHPLRWWPGDKLWLVQLLNYFMPWLLVGLIPSFIIALAGRRFRLAGVLMVPTLAIVISYAPLFLPRSRPVSADNLMIKVMSYNILAPNRNIKAVSEVIHKQQPDLLLLQEVRPWTAHDLKNRLADLYAGQELYFAYEANISQAVVSRYPLTTFPGALSENRTQVVRAETPAGSILVWNVHLSQPKNWNRHSRQVKNLVEAASTVKEPLIMGGDFNTTDQSEMYRHLTQHLHNAHWEAGWGFGFSFPASHIRIRGESLPTPTSLIRIDHLFYNDYLFARKAKTISTAGGSDHLPIMAEFLFTREVER